jgi:hypothetical protein
MRVISRVCLVVDVALVVFETLSPFFIHLFICSPGEQKECTDDEETSEDGSRCERRVERRRKKLINDGDDEDS